MPNDAPANAATSAFTAPGPPHRWWVDPSSPAIGRAPMHTIRDRFRGLGDVAGAPDTPTTQLDDGWTFRLVSRPEEAPPEFANPEYDDSAWDRTLVPHQWPLTAGYTPHYTNVQMPWNGEPPEVPDNNPTGLYRRRFLSPAQDATDRVMLHVGGAESALAIWINGHFIGTHKDSRLPAEFDITDQLWRDESDSDGSPPDNLLAAMVIRWSDGTWIEDQDHWYMGGIHREVKVYATPATFLSDIHIDAVLNEDYASGDLDVTVPVRFSVEPERGWQVQLDITDHPAGAEPIRSETQSVAVANPTTPHARMHDARFFLGTCARFSIAAHPVVPWSAENPALYRGTITLLGPDGLVVEVVPVHFGFTRAEVRNRELLINGQPVLIHGVNRHDHHPDRGKALLPADIKEDVFAIKRLGFNAIRTAHYPNDPLLLDLCDEIGLYVIDEANVECHARAGSLAHRPEFELAIFDRIRRTVRRDRNHPCVFAWSLGNESGYAPIHDAAAAWIRQIQPHRVVHYEGSMAYEAWSEVANLGDAASDLVCPMYPTIAQLTHWATLNDARPLIMCEYSHAMGNSNGGLDAYWQLIEETHGLQGGFIWDWKDQGLTAVNADGNALWAFGGTFGDEPNDANFNCNGVVGPDGSPHPAVWEHRFLTRPVDVQFVDGQFEVKNRRWFSDLADLRLTWNLASGDAQLGAGEFTVPSVAPQTVQTLVPSGELAQLIETASADRGPGSPAVLLTVRALTRADTVWAPADSIIALMQTTIMPRDPRPPADVSRPALTIEAASAGTDVFLAQGDDTELMIDVSEGQISISTNDVDTAFTMPSLSVWRPPTDNDGIKQGWSAAPHPKVPPSPRQRWLASGLDQIQIVDRAAGIDGSGLTVESRWSGHQPNALVLHTQRITFDGRELHFAERIEVPDAIDDLPRVGVAFSMVKQFDTLEWLGLGPHETYPDRAASGITGRWTDAIADQFVPFVVPQEHGFHCESEWFALSQEAAPIRVMCRLDGAAGFSALRHSSRDLTIANDLGQLRTTAGTHVHIDAAMRGLGTLACGPDTTPEFMVGPGTYEFAWSLEIQLQG